MSWVQSPITGKKSKKGRKFKGSLSNLAKPYLGVNKNKKGWNGTQWKSTCLACLRSWVSPAPRKPTQEFSQVRGSRPVWLTSAPTHTLVLAEGGTFVAAREHRPPDPGGGANNAHSTLASTAQAASTAKTPRGRAVGVRRTSAFPSALPCFLWVWLSRPKMISLFCLCIYSKSFVKKINVNNCWYTGGRR